MACDVCVTITVTPACARVWGRGGVRARLHGNACGGAWHAWRMLWQRLVVRAWLHDGGCTLLRGMGAAAMRTEKHCCSKL